jgi:hypothetical protein
MVEDEIKLELPECEAEDERLFLIPIPNDKLKHYLKTSKSLVCCDCGIQEVEWYPYAYDPEENDVWFVGKCPNCGELCFSKE